MPSATTGSSHHQPRTVLASSPASTPAALAPAPVIATASLTRLTLARRAARRCLTARAALS